MREIAIAAAVLLCVTPVAYGAKKVPGVKVYVGIEAVEGIVPPGASDSKADLEAALKKRGYAVVQSPEEATMHLILLRRDLVDVPTGSLITSGIFGGLRSRPTSIRVNRIIARLVIGRYENECMAYSRRWRLSAQLLVDHVTPIVLENLDKVR
jgi:hypothetical protein